MTKKHATMFKLVTAGGTICTAKFCDFDDDPEKGRPQAERHIQHQKDRWGAQPLLADAVLRIVEE